ncbi:Protein of unknown function [Propionibacterium freudenreichii]|nr:Protein of unknown function [Propionibacterium freudenreichii]
MHTGPIDNAATNRARVAASSGNQPHVCGPCVGTSHVPAINGEDGTGVNVARARVVQSGFGCTCLTHTDADRSISGMIQQKSRPSGPAVCTGSVHDVPSSAVTV